MITEDPELISEREGVHKRIQAEIQHEDKEGEMAEEVMLEIPQEWNSVPDLIMEDEEELMITEESWSSARAQETAEGRWYLTGETWALSHRI